MRTVSSLCVFVAFATAVASTFHADKTETSHLTFVTEYIRQLAAIESIRASAEQELKQGTKDDVLPNAIHTSTLVELELRSQITMLKGMRLNPPFDELIPNLMEF